jgi:hypothetical protein
MVVLSGEWYFVSMLPNEISSFCDEVNTLATIRSMSAAARLMIILSITSILIKSASFANDYEV